jgi:lon-related putative ATP-dependent protease
MTIEHLKVPIDKLTGNYDASSLDFDTTEDVADLEGTLGQDRAMSALELGLGIDAPGFNLYVSGVAGTGRNTALRGYLSRIAADRPTPPDWGYVYNFQDPTQPLTIQLPCGMMREFAQDMESLVDSCRAEIPGAFESDDYTHRVEDVMAEIQAQRQELTEKLEQEAQGKGFTLSFAKVGITPVPLSPEGQPLSQEEFNSLPDNLREELRKRAETIQHSIRHSMSEFRRLNKDAAQRTKDVDFELVSFNLKPIIDELQEKYAEYPGVVAHLERVEADVVQHVEMFKPKPETEGPQMMFMPGTFSDEDVFARYKVNDLVDNSADEGAPVVIEHSPTYYNLFGRIDYKARVGTLTTDHAMIKAGALHRANGGYLVLQARDLMMSPGSYDTLKRVLRSGEIRIENIGEQYTALPTDSLRPQPIPVDAKVIIVGGSDILRMLQARDEDFRRLFKVTADFDTVMDRNSENLNKYVAFIASQCRRKGLRHFDKGAVAIIINYSSRLVEDQDKLATQFMHISDIITESDYWARKDGADIVSAEHVNKTIDQRKYRASLVEDKMLEFITQNSIHIATEGTAVGQINGLAVYSMGDYSFGKPSRITARVSLGRGQVVNIERETQMSGKIHTKGFLILNGYIQGKYGHDRPLSMSASIGFEQTYSEVDGDSASSTELYTLLSELSGVGIKQGIAVTGSVNQMGDVQAIGGGTYKIEGFYDVCKAKGLTGEQGVMIPSDNVRNLALNDEVVQAVKDGKFHIYAVSTIDEGIEVLTDTPAGKVNGDGAYPEGTIHYLVEARLDDLAEKARQIARPPEDSENGTDSKIETPDEPPKDEEDSEDTQDNGVFY